MYLVWLHQTRIGLSLYDVTGQGYLRECVSWRIISKNVLFKKLFRVGSGLERKGLKIVLKFLFKHFVYLYICSTRSFKVILSYDIQFALATVHKKSFVAFLNRKTNIKSVFRIVYAMVKGFSGFVIRL